MSEQPEVIQAFAVLRRHLPESLRAQEAELEAAWFNGGPLTIDWPDRFLAAALVARDFGRGDLPRALERMAHFGSPAEVEAIGRALLGDTGETVQAEQLAESRRRSGLQWGPGRGLTS